jgi:flagellar protein
MSLAQLIVHPQETGLNALGPSETVSAPPSPAPPAPDGPPPELQRLVARLEEIQQGLEADRKLRCDAMNRLALMERTLHELEAFSRRVQVPTDAPSSVSKPPEPPADPPPTPVVAAVSVPRIEAAAVWEATLVAPEADTPSAEGDTTPVASGSSPRLVDWLDCLVDHVGPQWVVPLLDHYHRVGWIRHEEHAWLADLAHRMPPGPPRKVSPEALRAVHEETQRRLSPATVASE